MHVSAPPVPTSTPIPDKGAVVINFPGGRRASLSEDSAFDSALSEESSLTPPLSSSAPDPKLQRLISAGWVPAFVGRDSGEAPKLARPPMSLGPTQPDVVAALLAELKYVTSGKSQGFTVNQMKERSKQQS